MEVLVEKDKHYELEIIDMSDEGEGIGKFENFTLFVKGALLGDVVEICITQLKKNFGFANVTRLIKPSPFRTNATCEQYTECGGCQLQEMQYEMQLKWKQKRVASCLTRIGKLENVVVNETIGMSRKARYRNKAQYPIRKVGEEVVIGFFAQKSHYVVPVTDCILQPAHHEEILKKVKAFLEAYDVSIFNERIKKGLVRHLVIKSGNEGKEIMVCLVINGKELPHSDELVKALCTIGEIKSIVLSHSYENRKVTLGESCSILYGQDHIKDHIGTIQFKISPLAFFQVNPEQTEKLYGKALEYAGLTGSEIVWDAYCGIGSISLFLAQKAKKVYGVEIIPEAIEDAKENAKLNGLSNTAFYAGKAEEIIPKLYKEGVIADVMIVDPPRKGCDEKLLETIKEMAPKRVVYVSCNPSTLARDLCYLTSEASYIVDEVQPVDMFGHTMHVETVVLMSRVK